MVIVFVMVVMMITIMMVAVMMIVVTHLFDAHVVPRLRSIRCANHASRQAQEDGGDRGSREVERKSFGGRANHSPGLCKAETVRHYAGA